MMLHLIIDSGATKTHWAIPELQRHIFTLGINANYTTNAEIEQLFNEFLAANNDFAASDIARISYYGAGCGSNDNANRLHTLLQNAFPAAKITVASDLLGACHALCGNTAGLVAILGTGTASCLYDGTNITAQAPSLGYMLGDEGSGTHLGKQLITAVLRQQLPPDLQQIFNAEFRLTKQEIIQNIYQKSYPNRFFASFAPFLSKHLKNNFVHQLCHAAFTDFFDKQILYYADYQQHNLNIVGSVGFHFQEILRDIAQTKGATIGTIIQSPMDGLCSGRS